MNLIENVLEGLRSVRLNLLRSVITALIVTIGITALISVSTAIDAAQKSVSEGLSALGSNTFDIRSKTNRGGSSQGITEKSYPPVKLNETLRFIDQYRVSSTISLSAQLTQIAEVKHFSNKTNPNITAMGVNENYLGIKNLNLSRGRNFSSFEIDNGKQVVIIGKSIADVLFKNNEDPINQKVSFSGTQFKVI
jgi:putative ABC transport system permease protein